MNVGRKVEGGGFRAVRFDATDMQEVAETASGAMHERIGRGENVNGTPAAPLSRRQALAKARIGLPAIRDWKVTGETMARLGVRQVQDGSVTVGIDAAGSRKLIRLARWNSQYDQMVGLSEADQERVLAVQEQVYAGKNEGRTK